MNHKETCRTCDNERVVDCFTCRGSGESSHADDFEDRCESCDGSGVEPCGACSDNSDDVF